MTDTESMTAAPTTTGPTPTALTGGGQIAAAVASVVRGQQSTIALVTAALISGGHVLVEDLPGTGKTTLARAFARSMGGSFGRVQATADLMPSDITGSAIWEPSSGTFRFIPGPIFANVVVIDELNRTSPRTQSALMEALDESAVTVDGERHRLPQPFFAIATQNPAEQHGTFSLPEGELDRFAIAVHQTPLDLPTELAMVGEQLAGPTVDALQPVTDPAALQALRLLVRQTFIAPAVLAHAVEIVRATRRDSRLRQGASSRAALALIRTAQGYAVLAGRNYVRPDDTKAVAQAVLAHRLVRQASVRASVAEVVADLVADVPAPLEG